MYIYKITNNVNGRMYIGMHNGKKPDYMGSGVLLRRAYKKYGIKNFTKEILEECSSMEDLAKAEVKWIESENAINSDKYYNLASGGIGGDTGFHADTSMSDIVKEHWQNYTPEEREARIKSNWENFQGRDKSGSKNPTAKRAKVNGKVYDCLKDALIDFPEVSYSTLKRIAQNKKYDEKRNIKAEYI